MKVHGRVPFAATKILHRRAICTMLLVPDRYARVAHMTQRLFEAVLAGCLPLTPGNIRVVRRRHRMHRRNAQECVRLTFPKGAQLKDPENLFNARLNSSSVRAVDFREGEPVPEAAVKTLIVKAARLNARQVRHYLPATGTEDEQAVRRHHRLPSEEPQRPVPAGLERPTGPGTTASQRICWMPRR